MNQPITEQDLAGLIEGDLTDTRAKIVRAMVERDPVLTRRLAELTCQREMLKQLARHTAHTAPDRLADAAMSDAARDRMTEFATHTASAGRIRVSSNRPRHGARRTALIAAGIGLCVIGAWMWLVMSRVGPTALETAVQPRTVPFMDFADTPPPEGPRDVLLPGPDPIDRALAAAVDAPTPGVDFIGPLLPGQSVQHRPTTPLAQNTTLLDEWLSKLETPGELASIPLPQAATLARAGRLRVVLSCADSEAAREKLLAFAASKGGRMFTLPAHTVANGDVPTVAGTSTPASAPRTPSFSVVIDPGIDDAELASRLGTLLEDMAHESGGDATFVESSTPTTSPSAGDLLWWTRPPEQWRTRAHVSIPVELSKPAEGERAGPPG